MKVKDYKNLKVWEKGIKIVEKVYSSAFAGDHGHARGGRRKRWYGFGGFRQTCWADEPGEAPTRKFWSEDGSFKRYHAHARGAPLTDQYPKEERYTLTSQMRRAAVSIPSSIAEGFMRKGSNEYKHFLYVSLGSCSELETQSIISSKRQYMAIENYDIFLKDLNHEMRMLSSLIRKL